MKVKPVINYKTTLGKFNELFKKELKGKTISYGIDSYEIELTEDEIYLIKYHLKKFDIAKYSGVLKPVSKRLILDFISWKENSLYFIINSKIKL